jgi:hypothetical protein
MSPELKAPSPPPDLFVPSLQAFPRRPAARPFASQWLVFVAFFAGVLPTTALFVVQAYRLGAPRLGRALAVVGGLGSLLAIGFVAVRARLPVPDEIPHRALALVYFLYAHRRIRAAERAYTWLVSATRAKLLVPALVASVTGIAIAAAVGVAIRWVQR